MIKQAGLPLYLGTSMMFYKGTQAEFNTVFADFLAIPGVVIDVKPLSYIEAAAVTPLGWKDTQAYKWMGGSLYPSSTPTLPALQLSLPIIASLPSSWLSTYANVQKFIAEHLDVLDSAFWSLTPVKTNQIEKGYANGGTRSRRQGGRIMSIGCSLRFLRKGQRVSRKDLRRRGSSSCRRTRAIKDYRCS